LFRVDGLLMSLRTISQTQIPGTSV